MKLHTTPPWRVTRGPDGLAIEAEDGRVCTVNEGISAKHNPSSNGPANADLIAAAPHLLAACIEISEQASKLSGFPKIYGPWVGAVLAVRAAIRKARGEGAV